MAFTRRRILQAGMAVGASAVAAACAPPPGAKPPTTTRPVPTTSGAGPKIDTVVVVLADDMRFDYLGELTALDAQWINCVSAAIETPMCGPSRAAMFRGQYSSRTGVNGNSQTMNMDDRDTIATRIRAAGWRTVLAGKYLNDYPWNLGGKYVPPGWDAWFAAGGASFVHPGLDDTDYIFQVASQQIHATPANQPLFCWVAPLSPHLPATPPSRYANAQPPLPPIAPSFNEADVSDKPPEKRLPLMTSAEISSVMNERLQTGRSLLGVNDGLGVLKTALAATGRLDSSVIFFLSDNGFLFGEHRMVKKGEPYDEASRVPFKVRWAGVPGRTERGVVSSVDLSTTVCALAGTKPPGTDGVDLAPLLRQGRAVRAAAYIEPPGGGWDALRTGAFKYVEYAAGDRELYDLVHDPFELQNLAGVPAQAPTIAVLSAQLAHLRP